ncbi:MAG: hypothetical protein N2450_07220 [bacterium]|nr:hypothetical protein [bacterium]
MACYFISKQKRFVKEEYTMNWLHKLIVSFIIFFLNSVSYSAVFPRYYRDAVVNSLGGTGSLYSYSTNSMVYNPALLNRAKFHFDLVNLGLELDNKFLKVVQFVNDNSDKFMNFDSLSSDPVENQRLQQEFFKDIEPYDDIWFDLGVSPQFCLTFKHFGLVITSSTQPSIKIDRGIFNPAVVVKGQSDLVVNVGYGNSMTQSFFGKSRTFEYGIGVHYLNRRQLTQKRVSAADISSGNDIANEVSEDLKDTKTGFGIDVGTISQLTENWEGALVIHNLISSYDGKVTKPTVVLGGNYNLKKRFISNSKLVSRWDGFVEFRDFFNSEGTALFYKTHFGTEASFYERLNFRMGLNRGYLGFGVGIDVFVLKLNYAYYGEELGRSPGQLPSYRHQLQASVGW